MKAIPIMLILLCIGLTGFLYFTTMFDQTRSYEYEGQISPSNLLVSDVYDANPKINSLLTSLAETEYFRLFRINLARSCDLWSQSGKCRLNQCPIEEEDPKEKATHIKTFLIGNLFSKCL